MRHRAAGGDRAGCSGCASWNPQRFLTTWGRAFRHIQPCRRHAWCQSIFAVASGARSPRLSSSSRPWPAWHTRRLPATRRFHAQSGLRSAARRRTSSWSATSSRRTPRSRCVAGRSLRAALTCRLEAPGACASKPRSQAGVLKRCETTPLDPGCWTRQDARARRAGRTTGRPPRDLRLRARRDRPLLNQLRRRPGSPPGRRTDGRHGDPHSPGRRPTGDAAAAD